VNGTPLSGDLVFLITLAGVIGSGFFSGCETGFMSASKARLRHRVQRRPDGRADLLWRMLERLEDPILTCLIGNNLCLALVSGVATVTLIERFGSRGELLAMIVVSILILTFGEILPKVFYREYPERLMLASVRTIRAIMIVLAPVRWLLAGYSWMWRRLVPVTEAENGALLDCRNLSALLLAHSRPDSPDLQFSQAMQRFLELAHLDLSRVMRPLAELVSVPAGATVGACLATATRSGFSRLPVVEPGAGRLIGWILVRELLFLAETVSAEAELPPTLLRSPLLVDVGISAYELFEEFHGQGQQFAVVVDRAGKVMGLVTLEDLIEMVIGSIRDEYDTPQEFSAG